jgi:hypothetical protein
MSIQVTGNPLDERLTPNFTLRELIKTETGFPNLPSPEARENLKKLALKLEDLRVVLGPLLVISGYRSPELQTYLRTSGSSTEQAQAAVNSYHSLGIAADVQPLKMSAEKAWSIIASTPALQNSLGEIALKNNALHISLPTTSKQGVLMQVINDQYIRLSIEKIKEIIARNQVVVAAGSGAFLLLGALGFFLYLKRKRNR